MKRLYKTFGLEPCIMFNVLLSFISYLIPVAFKERINFEAIPVYGFLIFGSLSILFGITTILLLLLKDYLPPKFKEWWQIAYVVYFICFFINMVVSIFYAIFCNKLFGNEQLFYRIGNGFFVQFLVFCLIYLNIYYIYHQEIILYNQSSLHELISKK